MQHASSQSPVVGAQLLRNKRTGDTLPSTNRSLMNSTGNRSPIKSEEHTRVSTGLTLAMMRMQAIQSLSRQAERTGFGRGSCWHGHSVRVLGPSTSPVAVTSRGPRRKGSENEGLNQAAEGDLQLDDQPPGFNLGAGVCMARYLQTLYTQTANRWPRAH